ncbi:MAG TPA: hypothetical protein VGK46_10220 [Saprospiraceae bacterium]
MKRSSKILFYILVSGVFYSFFRMFTGHGGSGLYDFFDALVYSSIVLFTASLIVLLLNLKNYKQQGHTIIFMIIGLPLTVIAIRGTIAEIHYNRSPDLSVKYEIPVSREQYLFDSTNIKLAIDSMIALRNRKYGGPDVLYGIIDTIIYSQTGDKVFVSYMKKFERNHLGNDLDPDYLGADERDSIFWRLTTVGHQMGGSFHDAETLKKEVRKFYFNQFTFLDKDSTDANYFWRIVR